LGIANGFALLRLLPGGDRGRDADVLAPRHQLAVLHASPAGNQCDGTEDKANGSED
jgi:hypothetical protein